VRRRTALWVVAGAAALYLGWLGVAALRFKPYRVAPVPGGQEIEGVYHLHSRFSDGRATVEEIARKAAAAGLTFIILTDHGHPNAGSLAAQGWKSGVLVLAGSELSVSRGHLVALDFKTPERPFPQNAEQSMREIREQGGFSVVAHPYSKVRWNWGGDETPAGIEVLNGDSELRFQILRSLPWLPELLFNSRLALLKMVGPPGRSLAKWDQLNAAGRVYGYFASDAHLLYGPLLNFVRLHLFLKRPLAGDFSAARVQVFEALRSGKFYNAIDAAGEARGFRFWADRDGRRFPMGSEVRGPRPVDLTVRAPYPFPKEIRLLRDGAVVASTVQNVLSYKADGPGTYRVEVYLRGRTPLGSRVPWILSNPIFLREEGHDRP
jgi:hypothetical protein